MERTLTLTAKGQITLQTEVLAHLGVRPALSLLLPLKTVEAALNGK